MANIEALKNDGERTIYSSKSFAKDKENFKIENLVGTTIEAGENQKGGEQQYNTTVTPR